MIYKYSHLIEAVGKDPIEDETKYTQDMTRSFIDKLFFLDQIDTDVIVDFGCADGFILSKIRMLKPDLMLIGYDLDKQMLLNAKSNLDDKSSLLTDDWSLVLKTLEKFKKPTLLLSSVIHEVYSYSHPRDVSKFWSEKVFSDSFEYICIRDMIPSNEISKTKSFDDDVARVRELSEKFYLDSFEKEWGDISKDYRTFIHYLLKYRYKSNWNREVKENYVPISLQTLRSKIPGNYKIIFQDNYIYSYFRTIIEQDFGINIKQTTHTKMIIQRS